MLSVAISEVLSRSSSAFGGRIRSSTLPPCASAIAIVVAPFTKKKFEKKARAYSSTFVFFYSDVLNPKKKKKKKEKEKKKKKTKKKTRKKTKKKIKKKVKIKITKKKKKKKKKFANRSLKSTTLKTAITLGRINLIKWVYGSWGKRI